MCCLYVEGVFCTWNVFSICRENTFVERTHSIALACQIVCQDDRTCSLYAKRTHSTALTCENVCQDDVLDCYGTVEVRRMCSLTIECVLIP
jgi:hypothetical protein